MRNSAWAKSGPWLHDAARPTATTRPGWPMRRVHRARGGRTGTVAGISQVAGTWKSSSDEGEWSTGNTSGMEVRPKAHQGSRSLARHFGGREAATFR
jgi:hypothetical protein